MFIIRALLALLIPVCAFAAADLRRAEKALTTQCKTITSGTALEFFELACSTCSAPDRKEIRIQSLDVAYSTNSIRISSFAATTDIQGFPHFGFVAPYKASAGPSLRFFARRSSSEIPSSLTVCAQQLE